MHVVAKQRIMSRLCGHLQGRGQRRVVQDGVRHLLPHETLNCGWSGGVSRRGRHESAACGVKGAGAPMGQGSYGRRQLGEQQERTFGCHAAS